MAMVQASKACSTPQAQYSPPCSLGDGFKYYRRRRYVQLSESIREHLDEKIADLLYSPRRACMGSMEAARRIGVTAARSPIAASRATSAAMTRPSRSN